MKEICRICLENTPDGNNVSILFQIYEGKKLSQIITECASVQILENDELPKFLCLLCYKKLIALSTFRQLIIKSDLQLKKSLVDKKAALLVIENSLNAHYLNNIEVLIKEESNGPLKYQEKDNIKVSQDLCEFTSDLSEDNSGDNFIKQNELYVKEESNSNSNCSESHSEINLGDKNNDIQITLRPGRKPSKLCKSKRKIHEFQCNICHKMLYGRSNRLKQHILMAHSDIKNYPCEVCDKRFKSKQQLGNHQRIHTGEKPYQCECCQERFTSPQNLFNHRKKHTGDYKNYKCELCSKGYSTPGELETHNRISHTGEKPFLCEICSKAYSSIRSLGLHIRSVHEKNEKCPKCDLMLNVKRIKQHLQQHKDREEGIRRYTCDKCGKGFFSSHALRKHQVVHTGEKPYSCEICKKPFSQKSAVVTHMRVHSDIRSFSCEFCVKTFKYKQHLQLHIKKNHEEYKR